MLLTILMASVISSMPAALAIDDAVWHEGGYNSALRSARDQGKQLFIALVPDWSDYSRRMTDESLKDRTVTGLLREMVCIKYEQEDARAMQVARLYNVTQFPTLVVAGPDGGIEDVVIGFFPPGPLVNELQRIQSGQSTLGDHLQRVAAAPDDLAVRYAYGVKLDELGDAAGYQRELAAIRAADPVGRTITGARIHQQDVWTKIAADAPGGEDTYDLAPLLAHMETVTLPQGRFEGWNRIATFQAELERRAEAIEAFRAAAPDVPEAAFLDWGGGITEYVLENDQGDLPPDVGAFALELANGVVDAAVALGVPDEDGNTGFQGEGYEPWLAGRLDLLTRCQMKYPDGDGTAGALATCKRSLQLDPDNLEYQGRLAMLKDRR